MRVTGGSLSGRVFAAPKGGATRPSLERVRHALFQILGEAVQDAQVLDLYAGSGAFAFEALSRGAASATLVEASREAVATQKANATSLGLEHQVRCIPLRVERAARAVGQAEPYDLIFWDPPWPQIEAAFAILGKLLSRVPACDGARLLLQHPKESPPPLREPHFTEVDRRVWGGTAISVLDYKA